MDFSILSKALNEHPAAAVAALSVLALAWLFRDSRRRDDEHAEAVKALYESHVKALQDANAAHLQTAMQVAPLSQKLVTCIEVLERLSFPGALRGGAQ